jgi:hypothetical protein
MEPGELARRSIDAIAAEWVGFQGETPMSGMIAGLCRKLRDDDFLPDPMAHEAIRALAGRKIQAEDSMLHQQAALRNRRRLHDAVEEFAEEFFGIPVGPRLERWKGLVESCARKDPLLARLEGLKPGLKIDVSTAVDPSPAVQRLIDDLLTIFPLRQPQKAAEARSRENGFRSDPSLTDRERTRALKQLYRKHRQIAALSTEHLASLARPSRAIKVRIKMTFGMYLIIFFFIASTLSTVYSIRKQEAELQSKQRSNSPPPRNNLTLPLERNQVSVQAEIRSNFQQRLRRELTAIGKEFDDDQLDRVIFSLPVDDLPKVGGLGNIVLRGLWTEKVQSQFVARLKDGLRATGIDLTDQELDDLAPRCFPPPLTARPSTP